MSAGALQRVVKVVQTRTGCIQLGILKHLCSFSPSPNFDLIQSDENERNATTSETKIPFWRYLAVQTLGGIVGIAMVFVKRFVAGYLFPSYRENEPSAVFCISPKLNQRSATALNQMLEKISDSTGTFKKLNPLLYFRWRVFHFRICF
jgi:hypothetical protein